MGTNHNNKIYTTAAADNILNIGEIVTNKALDTYATCVLLDVH